MKKKCSACNEIKSISHFRRDKSRKDGYSYQCKQCASKCDKRSYQKHADKVRKRTRARMEQTRQLINEIKKSGCVRCGETHIACLEFHHPNPSVKELEIGASQNRKWEDVKREIDKCIILCANCHRKEHHPCEQT